MRISWCPDLVPALCGVLLLAGAGSTRGQATEARADSAAGSQAAPGDTVRPPVDLVDRIAAVVGEEIITLTELQQNVLVTARQLDADPADTVALRQLEEEVLRRMVEEKVILQRSRAEGITVSDQELTEAVDEDLAEIKGRFASEKEFEEALGSQGLTLVTYTDQIREEKRRRLLQQKFMQKTTLPPVRATDEEVRAYFEENAASFGLRPEQVEFEELLVRYTPSDSLVRWARGRADSALARIRAGKDFADVAREFSDDAVTREKGGDLGIIRRGEILPEIEGAVVGLEPGATSGVVQSPLGLHILRLEERKKAGWRLRHILVRVPIEEADRQRALKMAQEARERAVKGGDWGALVTEFGSGEMGTSAGGRVGPVALAELPGAYQAVLDTLPPGAVSPPTERESGYALLRLTARHSAGPYTFEEVRDRLREMLQQEKAFQAFVEDLKERTYIDIRL